MKRAFGMGDTYLVEHRDKMVGLVEPLDPGWGFCVDGGKSAELLPARDVENGGGMPVGREDNDHDDDDDTKEETKPLVYKERHC